jgi:hypothetical protein
MKIKIKEGNSLTDFKLFKNLHHDAIAKEKHKQPKLD